ncbi:hypothetical protein FQN54_002558 [Arachnomyces sp. PD_36]|nr:hypothetical protein FQN54_002558 [Arachnomyces sp. PD_36]
MSDSDSGASAPAKLPSDKELTSGLREAVATIFKTGKEEELTVKRVRLAAEKALGLDQGFFRGDAKWKAKSDQIIRDEVEKQEDARDNPPPKSSPAPPPPSKRSQPPKKAAATKRASTETQKSRKRQKTRSPSPSEDELSSPPVTDSEESEEDVVQKKSRRAAPAPKKQVKAKRPVAKEVSDTSELSDVPDEESVEKAEVASKGSPLKSKEAEDTTKAAAEKAEGSESEMSIVLDEEPKPKRKRGSSATGQAKKSKKEPASKAKQDANLDPGQAEIKRLQGWLIKCGIRKMWHRELAPYDTPKAKISHLKGMLKDAGMGGRYSVEKAKKIKEERELRADLEMVQEGAKRWGADGAGDESEEEKPRRRLARGLKNFDFLGDDGEETD